MDGPDDGSGVSSVPNLRQKQGMGHQALKTAQRRFRHLPDGVARYTHILTSWTRVDRKPNGTDYGRTIEVARRVESAPRHLRG